LAHLHVVFGKASAIANQVKRVLPGFIKPYPQPGDGQPVNGHGVLAEVHLTARRLKHYALRSFIQARQLDSERMFPTSIRRGARRAPSARKRTGTVHPAIERRDETRSGAKPWAPSFNP